MAKRIEIDGKFYRERRGVLVEIPAEWVGKITTEQTMRKRPSKQKSRQAREVARQRMNGFRRDQNYHENRDSPITEAVHE